MTAAEARAALQGAQAVYLRNPGPQNWPAVLDAERALLAAQTAEKAAAQTAEKAAAAAATARHVEADAAARQAEDAAKAAREAVPRARLADLRANYTQLWPTDSRVELARLVIAVASFEDGARARYEARKAQEQEVALILETIGEPAQPTDLESNRSQGGVTPKLQSVFSGVLRVLGISAARAGAWGQIVGPADPIDPTEVQGLIDAARK